MVILFRKLNNVWFQSYLLHFDNLAVANLHCRVDCVADHVMLNAVSENLNGLGQLLVSSLKW